MFPVALSMVNKLGVSFLPLAITLMMGASCAFINPVSFQTNLLVQGPGDFAKVGLPLTAGYGSLRTRRVPPHDGVGSVGLVMSRTRSTCCKDHDPTGILIKADKRAWPTIREQCRSSSRLIA
jgi:hypothetical protein